MVLLGDLSYSIYTVHTWTLRLFERRPGSFRPGLGIEAVIRIALAIALTLILSSATYRLIEVPARGWLRRAVKRRLEKVFGPREQNLAPAGWGSYRYRVGTMIGFLVVLAGLVAYQFVVVPRFLAYTR